MMRPLAICRLRVTRRHVLRVFVWPTKKAMYAYTQKWYSDLGRTYEALCGIPPLTIKPRNVVKQKVVGDLHFVNNRFGGGIFAHELQHFIQSWINIKGLEPTGKDWENVAYLVGELTAAFWEWFYKTFERG